MSTITLPWSMEQDRINEIKASSTHVDDNFNTLLNAVNGKLDADGSTAATGDLSMGGNKITNLALPTVSADAATKGYVDSAIVSNTKIASSTQLGQVKIGQDIAVDTNGVISVARGGGNTTATAAIVALRACSLTNSVPVTGVDGVVYFTYSA